MEKEPIKINDWEEDLFDIIDWNAFGTFFWEMMLSDRIQIFTVAQGMLPGM